MRFQNQAQILVRSLKGEPCPRQNEPGRQIGTTPEYVPNTRFYRQRLAEKALILVDDTKPARRQRKKVMPKKTDHDQTTKTTSPSQEENK